MEVMVTRLIENLLFPPGLFLALYLLAIIFRRRQTRVANSLLIVTTVLFYLASIPATSHLLMATIQGWPALDVDQLDVSRHDAIVVLSAGRYTRAPEYGGKDTVSRLTLERMRYGAWLHRKTGLPLLVSGGRPLNEESPLADLMAESLQRDFGITGVWTEDRSRTTWENAQFSHDVLHQKGLNRILLVTHSWHMPRAMASFAETPLQATAAPTEWVASHYGASLNWIIPQMAALKHTRLAMHEILGRVWYSVRH